MNAKHKHFYGNTNNANGIERYTLQQDLPLYNTNPGMPIRYPDIPGQEPNALDYIIGTSETIPLLSNFQVHDPIDSDHAPISIDVKISEYHANNAFLPKPLFDKAKWDNYKAYIRRQTDEFPTVHENRRSIDQANLALTETIQAADKKFIPKTQQPTKTKQPFPQAIVSKIKEKRKRRLRRNYIASRNPDVKRNINRLSREIKFDIQNFKQDQPTNLWQSVNYKKTNLLVNYQKIHKATIITCRAITQLRRYHLQDRRRASQVFPQPLQGNPQCPPSPTRIQDPQRSRRQICHTTSATQQPASQQNNIIPNHHHTSRHTAGHQKDEEHLPRT
jgi:hypothetical protein